VVIDGKIVDLVYVLYKPDRITPEKMLETIRQQGFTGKIVKE